MPCVCCAPVWPRPQIIPVVQANIAPAEPGQGDEIDLFAFAHGLDNRHEFLVDRIIRPILLHLDHAVVGAIGSILVRTRVGVLDVEFTRLSAPQSRSKSTASESHRPFLHLSGPRLGEFLKKRRRTRILVPSRELTSQLRRPMLDRRQGHRRAIGLSGPAHNGEAAAS